MNFTYTKKPSQAKGKTDVEGCFRTEAMAQALGGKWNRGSQSWRLSDAQLRDMEALIDKGFTAVDVGGYGYGGPVWVFRLIGKEYNRKEATALCAVDKRCTKTLEMFPERTFDVPLQTKTQPAKRICTRSSDNAKPGELILTGSGVVVVKGQSDVQ